MMKGAWNSSQVTMLEEMWAAGLSGSEIGAAVGKSRSAVLGMVRRRKLPFRVTLQRRPPGLPAKPKRKLYMTARRKAAVHVSADIPMPKPEPVQFLDDVWSPLTGARPVTMEALAKGMCKWPIGEGRPYLFCGCPAMDGRSYCASHDARSKGNGTSYERHALKDARAIVSSERRAPEVELV
jgi:GcrA cell cycle regulator